MELLAKLLLGAAALLASLRHCDSTGNLTSYSRSGLQSSSCDGGSGQQDDSCSSGDGTGEDGKRAIYLLTLLPYYNPLPALNPSWEGGDDIQPVLELAKDQINSNTEILANYTLELDHGRDGCDIVTETSLGFLNHIYSPSAQQYVGIIGPGCSSSSAFVAILTGRPEVSLVMVHGGGAPSLSDRTLYRSILGTLGSTEQFVEGFLHLALASSWTRVAVLYDDSRLFFLGTKRLLVKKIPTSSISVQFLSPVSFTFLPLDAIKDGFLRVILVLCPLELTQRIMCLAKNNSMVYEDFQFIIMSHSLDALLEAVEFTYNGERYYCSEEDMAVAMDYVFLMNYHLTPNSGLLISDTSYSEFLDYYAYYRDRYNQRASWARNSIFSEFATYFYDSVWAWALVLDNLTKSYADFEISGEYGNVAQTEKIIDQFYNISFEGMSGKVTYSRESGFTPRQIDIFQVYDNSSHLFASINSSGSLVVPDDKMLFSIPDSFENVTLRENRGLAIFFNIVTVFQTVLVVILHVLTVIYQKKPSIKATSPKLHHLTFIGIYIILIGLFTWTLNPAALINAEKRHYFCHFLWAWCLPIGFTLTFGPVAMRTWRIYRIFKHYLNPGPFISDPVLIVAVVVLLVLDLVLGVAWTAVDPYVVRPVMALSRERHRRLMIRLDCECQYLDVWIAVLFTYKLIVLFAVTVFAVLTRRIMNSSFATTFLRVLVYLMAIVVPLGFAIYAIIIFMGIDDPMAYFSFITLCVLLQLIVTFNILCIFVPPVALVFKRHGHYKPRNLAIARVKFAESENSSCRQLT